MGIVVSKSSSVSVGRSGETPSNGNQLEGMCRSSYGRRQQRIKKATEGEQLRNKRWLVNLVGG